jgi:hypothetical protein
MPTEPMREGEPYTRPELTKKCVDCGQDVPLSGFQRTPKGGLASDCKACRRAKYEKGVANKTAISEKATKEWIIKEAQRLYADSTLRVNDKIKLLDTISRNLNENERSITDDAKIIRDLIASKKKLEGK